MPLLVLIRHGQSIWNQQNRFTGWVDVPLTPQGEEEAKKAADHLKNLKFDVAYTSNLSRAQSTLQIIQDELRWSIPVIRDSALNERRYGDLQGLDKAETARIHGAEQVQIWRRSFDTAPPNGESLKDTAARALPFFERCIMGDIRHGRNVLVVAHGNSNRSIVMQLDKLTGEEVLQLELATGVPLVYAMTDEGAVISRNLLL